jgi:hypothetical protein
MVQAALYQHSTYGHGRVRGRTVYKNELVSQESVKKTNTSEKEEARKAM